MTTNLRQTCSADRILREAAARLKKDRPGMSLRATAAKLGISPSYWSKILNGKSTFPQSLLARVVKVLCMDEQTVALLQRAILEAIEKEGLTPATGIKVAARDSSPVEGYGVLGRSEFWILDEWFFIPVLNAFTLPRFPREPGALAARLGIMPEDAARAIRLLREHGLLRERPGGGLERSEEKLRLPTDRSHASVRRYHRALLRKAHEELSLSSAAETFERRLISGVCFTGSGAKMKEARLIMEEAMYRVANLMADAPDAEDIYQLNLQIFPVNR
jgi:uncharacterized protein (TIGR02147 family)